MPRTPKLATTRPSAPRCIRCGMVIGPGQPYTTRTSPDGAYAVNWHTVCPGDLGPTAREPMADTAPARVGTAARARECKRTRHPTLPHRAGHTR